MNLHIVELSHDGDDVDRALFHEWLYRKEPMQRRHFIYFCERDKESVKEALQIEINECVYDAVLAMGWPADRRQVFLPPLDSSLLKLADAEFVVWRLTGDLPSWVVT